MTLNTPKASRQTPNTLNKVAANSLVKIKGIICSDPVIRNRLMSFGLITGRELKVTKKSPMGETICVELIGFSLALRLTEADAVSVLV